MRSAAAVVLAATLAAPGGGTIALPEPVGQIPPTLIKSAFPDRPDRLRVSVLPGRVDDTERVEVLVGPTGVPAVVSMTQRLVLSGTGQFVVYERSSARGVTVLEDTNPPALKREALVWTGFVPGREVLAARLALTPEIERELLPIGVELRWSGGGRVEAGGGLPGAGRLTVRLVNRTHRAVQSQTGDVPAALLAGPLERLRRYAAHRRTTPPPVAGRGLPLVLPATGITSRDVDTFAPLRVDGTIAVEGAGPVRVDGPTVTPLATGDGARIGGVLDGDATFTVDVPAAGRLALDVTAVPSLDPRLLVPDSATTWPKWAAQHPSAASRRAALDTLVDAAWAAARDDEYAPYLGHHGPGPVHTSYRVRLAAPEQVHEAAKPLRPKPFAISLAALALLAIVANGTALWRRL